MRAKDVQCRAGPLHSVVAAGIQDAASPHHVVHHNHAAGPGELYRPFQVGRVVDLVRIEEEQVKGAGQRRQGVQGRPHPHSDPVREPGGGQIGAGHLGMAGLVFTADQLAAGRQRPCQPGSTETAQGTDLQDPAGTGNAGQQHQELSLRRGDLDGRQSGGNGGGHNGVHPVLRPHHLAGQILLDLFPVLLMPLVPLLHCRLRSSRASCRGPR